MTRKAATLAVLLLVMLGTVVACGAGAATTTQTASTTDSEVVDVASNGSVNLVNYAQDSQVMRIGESPKDGDDARVLLPFSISTATRAVLADGGSAVLHFSMQSTSQLGPRRIQVYLLDHALTGSADYGGGAKVALGLVPTKGTHTLDVTAALASSHSSVVTLRFQLDLKGHRDGVSRQAAIYSADSSTAAFRPSIKAFPTTSLWSTSMESGTLGSWSTDGGGGMYNTGSGYESASTGAARTGSWSLKETINTSSGTSGARAFRWDEARAHRTAYYSIWLYIPTSYRLSGSGEWWNAFQFKSRTQDGSCMDPVWAFYANEDAGGLYLRAGWGWGDTPLAGPYPGNGVSGKWYAPITKRYLPVGRWVHLEAYLRQSKDYDGVLRLWQDGTLLFDLTGIRTSFKNCNWNTWCANNEWSANLYSDGMSPNPASVYWDDSAITNSYIL